MNARRVWTERALMLAALTVSGWWALVPPRVPRTAERAAVPPVLAAAAPEPFDEAAFRVPIWVAPPVAAVAEAPPPPPPPPPPLRLQLLSIVREAGGLYRAVLYDPDTDRLVTLTEGETLGTGRVERIDALGVSLREGELLRTLALHTDRPVVGGAP